MTTARVRHTFPALTTLTILACMLTFGSVMVLAQSTRLWQQNHFDEFERGTSKGIAIASDGRLELAPAFKTVFTSPSTYIWSVASDAEGNAYIAAGAPARVYKVTPAGKATIIFEAKELQVQVVRIGPDGAIYAATSPDGKVYRIAQGKGAVPALVAPTPGKNGETVIPVDASYTSKLFFDPKEKYVWDMVFDAQGRLYIATGDQGSIYRVERNGEGKLFFKSDEAHFRSLLIAQDGNLIAGTDGSGLIYRITPAGEAFVLYSASKKEITALAQDGAGNLYAAGVGDKHGSGGGSPVVIPPPTTSGTPSGQAANNPVPILVGGGGSTAGGSEIYQLAPDGSPRKMWSTRDNLIYCMQVLDGSTLLVGTGNRGRLYTVTPDGKFTDLLKASANQVTQFAISKNGIYAVSANLGKLFLLTPKQYEDGSFESDVFDAESFSQWGRAEVLGSGPFDLWARTGNVDNPDRNWSAWKHIDLNNPELDLPAARFAQWKVELHCPRGVCKVFPSVESVGINYRVRNLAPVVDDIAVQPGARFPAPSGGSRGSSESVTVSFGGHESTGEPSRGSGGESPSTATKDKNWIAVRWQAHDENDDELEYAVYYRGENETAWKLLKDHIAEKYYSVESAFVPDGAYVIRVVASDAPSHTSQDALSGEKISQRFVVDTTPPRIEQLAGTLNGDQIHVTFRAVDSFSPIKRAEYSVDAREWQFVEPVTQISDSPTENYDFNAKLRTPSADTAANKNGKKPGNGAGTPEISNEHVVVVRVYDRYDNMSTAKIVVKP